MGHAEDMILFAEVAETGSFTQAGMRLRLPKSTVSQRISGLEARLGLRLLNRSTRAVTLTAAGLVYLDHCRRLRTEAEAAGPAMCHLKDQPEGTIRIPCAEVTATHFLPGFLAPFTAAYPGIAVDILATNRPVDLIAERVDFAFRVGDVVGQELIQTRLAQIRRSLVAAKDCPLEGPRGLAGLRCLVLVAQPEWTRTRDGTTHRLRPRAAAQSDSMGFLLQAAVQGLGVALLPTYVCRPYLATGQLHEILPGWQIPPSPLSLVMPNARHRSAAQHAFHAHARSFDYSGISQNAPAD